MADNAITINDEDFPINEDGPEAQFDVAERKTFKYPLNIGDDAAELQHSVIFYINARENTRAARQSANTSVVSGSTSGTKLGRPNEEGLDNLSAAATGGLLAGGFELTRRATQAATGNGGVSVAAGLLSLLGLTKDVNDDSEDIIDIAKKEIGFGKNFGRVRLQQAIELFVSGPPTAEYSANWENKELGIFGGAMTQGNVKLNELIGAEGEGDFDIPGTNRSMNLSQFKGLAGGLGRSVIQGAAQLPGKLGVAGELGAAFDLLSGNTLNPYKEQLFQSMGFRKFGFGYKFMPKSNQELQTVMNIVQLFKYHMHPERNDANYTLIYPSEFEIEYRYKGQRNEYLSKIAPCALTDVKISYGGADSFTSFKDTDGAPIEINLQLSFAELETLSRRGVTDSAGTGVDLNWRNSF